MGIIITGLTGTPLRNIIAETGADNCYIECRCKWTENGNEYDEFFGGFKYINGELIPLDHDSYSLDDLYNEWEYHKVTMEDSDLTGVLTVWEHGEYEDGK